jgi:hypothetical protein
MSLLSDVKLEKSIVIDPEAAKQLEESGTILPSDGFYDRFDGERSMPIGGNAVDAETAMRLAAEKGISLSSVGAPVVANTGAGKNMATSHMPAPILESFKHQPPMVPNAPTTEFNPEFLSKVKDASKRMNNILGETTAHRAPESTVPVMPRRGEVPLYNPPAAPSASVDYPLIRMIVTEAVKEALQGINLKEVVREVLKEENERKTSKTVNENVIIKLGETVLAGKVTRLELPKKK